MFTKSPTEAQLDDEIARLVRVLKNIAPDDYEATLTKIDRLQKMKTAEMRSSPRVSPDILVGGAFNILGIAMILQYEHLHPLTSKAISFIRLR